MPAAMEGFLQLTLSFLTGALSEAAPVAEGQAPGSPGSLSLPPSADTALLPRLALSINQAAPVVTTAVPAAGRRHGTSGKSCQARSCPFPALQLFE